MYFLPNFILSSSELWTSVPLISFSLPLSSISLQFSTWSMTILAALLIITVNHNKNSAAAQSFSSGLSAARTSSIYFWYSQILDRVSADWRHVSNQRTQSQNHLFVAPRFLSFWSTITLGQRQTTGQWIVSLFSVILFCNAFGLIPFSEAITGKTGVTIGLSIGVWSAVTIAGVIRQKQKFPSLFLPSGPSAVMAPVFILLESVSYTFRALSLGIRLWANMLAGHQLIHLISGMALVPALCLNVIFGAPVTVLTCGLLMALTGLELMVCVLQSGVFCLLTGFYLHEVLSQKVSLSSAKLKTV